MATTITVTDLIEASKGYIDDKKQRLADATSTVDAFLDKALALASMGYRDRYDIITPDHDIKLIKKILKQRGFKVRVGVLRDGSHTVTIKW